MMRYKFIHFEHIGGTDKTHIWSCKNNRSGDELGKVSWYSSWRQYCYEPTVCAVYSAGCLHDIAKYLDSVNGEHKRLLAAAKAKLEMEGV